MSVCVCPSAVAVQSGPSITDNYSGVEMAAGNVAAGNESRCILMKPGRPAGAGGDLAGRGQQMSVMMKQESLWPHFPVVIKIPRKTRHSPHGALEATAHAHGHGHGHTKARMGDRTDGREGKSAQPEPDERPPGMIQGCGAANHLQLLAGGWGGRRPS